MAVSFEDVKKSTSEKYATGRSDIESAIEAALKELDDTITQAQSTLDTGFKESGVGDPVKRIGLTRNAIDTALADILPALDAYRTGSSAPSATLDKLLSSAFEGMGRLTSGAVSEAGKATQDFATQKANLQNLMGTKRSELQGNKGKWLADLMGAEAGELGKIGTEEARMNETLRQALLSKASPEDLQNLYKSFGMTYNPKGGTLNFTGATGGGTQVGGGGGAAGGGTDFAGEIARVTEALKALGGGSETTTGSRYTMPGADAFSTIDRWQTADALSKARANVANQYARSTNPRLFR